MQTIKITPSFKSTLDSIVAEGKSPWVIINEDYAVGAYAGRAAARSAKSVQGVAGKIMPASEVKFQVVDLTTQAAKPTSAFAVAIAQLTQPVAPAINKTALPVVGVLADYIAELSTPTAKAKATKIPVLRASEIERPCKRVWYIADEMMAAAGGLANLRRKDVLARCVGEKIAYYTARTQYQLWLTIQNGGSI